MDELAHAPIAGDNAVPETGNPAAISGNVTPTNANAVVDYPFHVICEDYADYTQAERLTAYESLREHGLLVPVVLWRREIVDGRHRTLLCRELRIPLRFDDISEKTEEQMLAHVRVLNEHRRANTKPLTTAEKRARIEVALKANPGRSSRQIAKDIGVSHPTVETVRTELENEGRVVNLHDVKTVSAAASPPHKQQPFLEQLWTKSRSLAGLPQHNKEAEAQPAAKNAADIVNFPTKDATDPSEPQIDPSPEKRAPITARKILATPPHLRQPRAVSLGFMDCISDLWIYASFLIRDYSVLVRKLNDVERKSALKYAMAARAAMNECIARLQELGVSPADAPLAPPETTDAGEGSADAAS